MEMRRTWMRKALLGATFVAAPALVGLSCQPPLTGPVVGPGLVDEAAFQARVDQYLQLTTPSPNTSDPIRVITQLERNLRNPAYVPPVLPSNAFAGAFAQMATLEDTSDFRALYLVNLLLGYRDHPGLGAEQVSQIENALFSYKYWWDEPTPAGIIDDNYYWSENHQLIFHAIEYLMGQEYPDQVFSNDDKTGAEHRAHARPLILDWLEHRMRFGFAEWHSDVY